MNKREQQKEETLHDILRVSETLFHEKGYEKTTIANIAEGCGLSKGAMYHHFKSKEEVLERICLNQYEMMKQLFAPIVEESDLSMKDRIKKIMTVARESAINTAAASFSENSKSGKDKPSLSSDNAAMEKLFDYYSEKIYIEIFAPLLEFGRAAGECDFSCSGRTMALFVHHLDSGMTGELQRIISAGGIDAKDRLLDLVSGFVSAVAGMLEMKEESVREIMLADEMISAYHELISGRNTA